MTACKSDITAIDWQGTTSEGFSASFTAHYVPELDEPVRLHGCYLSSDGGGFFDVECVADLPHVVLDGTFTPVGVSRSSDLGDAS